MLLTPLNYQLARTCLADNREMSRGSGSPTPSDGFTATRNRDVCIPNNGTGLEVGEPLSLL